MNIHKSPEGVAKSFFKSYYKGQASYRELEEVISESSRIYNIPINDVWKIFSKVQKKANSDYKRTMRGWT